MVRTSKTIHIESDSDLDRILDEIADEPVILERAGRHFRLSPLDQEMSGALWENYDPEQALESILSAIGGWEGLVDAEEFKRYIYERRRTANRPSFKL